MVEYALNLNDLEQNTNRIEQIEKIGNGIQKNHQFIKKIKLSNKVKQKKAQKSLIKAKDFAKTTKLVKQLSSKKQIETQRIQKIIEQLLQELSIESKELTNIEQNYSILKNNFIILRNALLKDIYKIQFIQSVSGCLNNEKEEESPLAVPAYSIMNVSTQLFD